MTSPRTVGIRLTLTLGVLAAACTSFPVDTDYNPEVDFAVLRHYVWSERDPNPSADPRVDNDLLDGRIRRAVDAALALKGYQPAGAAPADFEITYHVAVERAIDVETYIDAYPRGYRWGAGLTQAYTNVREYDVGSLVLDVLSGDSQKLIWRGSTQAEIDQAGTPEARTQRVRDAVDAILAQFPPP